MTAVAEHPDVMEDAAADVKEIMKMTRSSQAKSFGPLQRCFQISRRNGCIRICNAIEWL